MIKKSVSTVDVRGNVSKEEYGTVAPADVERDMAEEMRRIGSIARSPSASILTVEPTAHHIVVIYTSGAVKIYRWV